MLLTMKLIKLKDFNKFEIEVYIFFWSKADDPPTTDPKKPGPKIRS